MFDNIQLFSVYFLKELSTNSIVSATTYCLMAAALILGIYKKRVQYKYIYILLSLFFAFSGSSLPSRS